MPELRFSAQIYPFAALYPDRRERCRQNYSVPCSSRQIERVCGDGEGYSWRDEFNQPATNYRNYRETWLLVCKNISQAGKPVILCGAGVPDQFEQCIERRYFSNVHYLALVCEIETLTSRLRNRPAWRGSSKDEYIEEHLKFNRWLIDNAQDTQPPMTLLNTSEITVDESVQAAERWIHSHLNGK